MEWLRTWLTKKRIWIPLTLYAVYAVFGFLILPGILRGQIVDGIRKNLGREAALTRVRVNPIMLSLTLEGFDLKDADGTSFVAFDRFHADFQLSSLVRWALTFRVLALDGPRIHARLMPDGTMNFDDLIPKEEGKPPRLVIGSFQIHRGSVQVSNRMASHPEEATLTPIDLTLENFTTIPQKEGLYHITATDPGGGAWEWTGDLTFEPLHSAGVLDIAGSRLRPLWEVAKHRVGFEVAAGELGCHLEYAVDVRGDSLIARVTNSSLAVTRFGLREKGAALDLLTLDSLTVRGVEMAYPQQTVAIDRVLLAGANVQAWLNPDTTLNWMAMLPATPPAAPSRTPVLTAVATYDTARAARVRGPAAPAPEWTMTLGELAVRDLDVAFEDRTIDPAFAVSIAPVNATLRNVSSRLDAPIDVATDVTIAGKGRFDASGTVVPEPVAADLAIKLVDLPLPIFQPYLKGRAKLQLVSGTLGVAGDVRVREGRREPDIRFKGRVESRGFHARDQILNEPFLSWKSVVVNAIDYAPSQIAVGGVRLDQPYGRFLVHKDRTTNIQDILGLPTVDTVAVDPAKANAKAAKGAKGKRPPPPKTSETLTAMQHSAAAAKPRVPVRIGTVEVVEGSADFSDLSLILPFAARIEHLGGTVKGLSSDSAARAAIVLDGKLQPTGIAQVRGELNPLAQDVFLDVTVVFREFNMPTLTPYGGTFLGREIDKGKMSLDLGYRLQGRHLVGSNKIQLDQLELGQKVESPEATHLPVGLVIAILKDREGKIDLDMPVEGDLDDPKFRIGPIIWDFILSLLTKVATAPFALLGGLFGGGGGADELGHIDFEAGSSAVPADQQESLAKLAEALGKRPALKLEVRGQSDAAVDAAAIRRAKFEALAGERLAADPKRYGTGLGYPPRLLEDLYVERFGKDAMKALDDRYRIEAGALPPDHPRHQAGSKKVVLDESARSAAIQDTLTALQKADDADLLALANARAAEVKQRLVALGVEESRLYMLDPQPGKVENGRIRLELALTD
jgi:Domain of Unknown Function (DUF748)